MRRPYFRAIASSLCLTILTLGFLSASARLVSRLTNGWFGPLPEIVEVEEPKPKPEPEPELPKVAPPPRVAPVRKQAPIPESILADPTPTERLAFRPYRENGQVTGLQFSGVPTGSMFDLLGLQKGDVLLDINGYRLNDPEEGLRAYAALRRAPHLRVKLLRDGRPQEIVIHIL